MSILISSLLFSFATFFSRILGLLRDVFFAKYFGVSYLLDAYFISIMFPFFLRKVFGEGAMSSAFVPLYSEKKEKDEFLSSVINGFSLIIFTLLSITYIFPEIIVNLFGAGATQQTKEIAANLIFITAPATYFIFLWAISYSIYNTKDSFFWPALTPSISNIFIIIGILFSKKYGIYAPTIGFLIGSIIMFFSLSKSLFSHRYYFTLKYFPEFIRYFIPTFFTMTISQVNTIVDMNVSSFFSEGSISYLQYASRFYLLPYGLFAVSVSTVVLSKISSNRHLFKNHVNNALKTTLLFTIPSSVGLIYLSQEIIKFFYEHGQFSQNDTLITSKILIAYSIGLPFYGIYSTISRSFHAMKNTKIPFYATLYVSISNIALDLIFGIKWGPTGVAFATSIAGMIGSIYLIFKIKTFPILDLFKIFSSSIIMLFGIVVLKNVHFLIQILLAIIIYFFVSYIFYRNLIKEAINVKKK
ncbi:membrane protein [Thermosipho melanesiensis]|uniref:Probable lipid II flippase MurJ n=2 Tax=Thermosipho melanesiensis TaxID=46541 RepID=A6LNF0_THEM4|nr:murein biosynthesis integral membrane protein MurJ [Thermosipho melanesiensis]ABR31451.1 integral membrane protein MviN [Thermosipho melanesiensis BI429]APT74510.1 membrane protein [Thermosipho melanesiensis]OOC36464.1 membrane protein [Thermosipho melanesiensis]OOC37282.1 membrane protein [Thermosipho melanesiensis]OOC38034.1 membrane protein [Thermosipho melanesiensis]